MFDIEVIRERGRTLLRLTGQIDDPTDDLLLEAFAFVQPMDHLVLDLTSVTVLDRRGARFLHDVIDVRSVLAECVVVSTVEAVSMALVLSNVDRVSPIVRGVEQAIAILDCRGAGGVDQFGSSALAPIAL